MRTVIAQPDQTLDERTRLVIGSWHWRCMRAAEMARLTAISRQFARPWLCLYGLAFALVLPFGGRAGGDVSSLLQQQPQTAARTFRPMAASDHDATLAVEDLHIRDLLNQRGL